MYGRPVGLIADGECPRGSRKRRWCWYKLAEIEKVEFHARELSVNEAETIQVPEKYNGRQVDQTQEKLFGQVLLLPTNRRSQLAQKASGMRRKERREKWHGLRQGKLYWGRN